MERLSAGGNAHMKSSVQSDLRMTGRIDTAPLPR
jgi:hypothetical protein